MLLIILLLYLKNKAIKLWKEINVLAVFSTENCLLLAKKVKKEAKSSREAAMFGNIEVIPSTKSNVRKKTSLKNPPKNKTPHTLRSVKVIVSLKTFTSLR